MMVTIQSEFLTVDIEDAGAQLASVRDKQSGTEYLWQGDPQIWNRRAPLLFPIIARLKDHHYEWNGKTWTIPDHGFCRSAPFALAEQGKHTASFRYADTAETKEVYPFSFVLTVTYRLEGRKLIKSHTIENRSDVPMLYELGGHDGYRAPLEAGETMSGYAIRFPGLDAITPYGMDARNMITPKTATYQLPNGRMPLTPSSYHLDTVILDNLPERKAILEDQDGKARVIVEFADFPYLGVWTMAKEYDTNYVCIEPWTTLPDATFVGRALADKAGIRTLQAGAREILTFAATFQ